MSKKYNHIKITELCVDAMQELERASQKHPDWNVRLTDYHPLFISEELNDVRALNDNPEEITAYSIFMEEVLEMIEAAQSGNLEASRQELRQVMAVLMRIDAHLPELVSDLEPDQIPREAPKALIQEQMKADPYTALMDQQIQENNVGHLDRHEAECVVLAWLLKTKLYMISETSRTWSAKGKEARDHEIDAIVWMKDYGV